MSYYPMTAIAAKESFTMVFDRRQANLPSRTAGLY